MTKILFLDLDGTVRRPKSGATFINDPYDQELIPGVQEALSRYKDWKIIGITNQGGVGAGFKSLEDCIIEQRETLRTSLYIECVYLCPDSNGRDCYFVDNHGRVVSVTDKWAKYAYLSGTYRKPNPGMVGLAIARLSAGYNYPEKIDRESCLFVGDHPEDEQCAKNAGIPFMWASEWRKDV